MQVILYSNKCPKCVVLEKKLKQKRIPYKEINDVEMMKERGYLTLPVLEVDGECMDFKMANYWINNYGED